MGIATVEKNFPRGGRKPAIALPKKGSFNLFGKKSQKKSHLKKTSKKTNEEREPSSKLKLTYAEPPTLKTLKEGMLVLSCVQEIKEYEISVCLPGRIIGQVPITNISAPYTKALKDLVDGSILEQSIPRLEEMFYVGQNIVVRIMEINYISKYQAKITLSIAPEVVQSDWSFRTLTENSVLMAAVRSQEDNGYIMDTGIKNVRAFLKKSAAREYEKIWNRGELLGVGHLVRCLVTKSDIAPIATTVELTADPRKVHKAEADSDEVTIDSILPGTLLSVSISKILKNGLEVQIGMHFTGYIHRDHLSAPWDKPQDYTVGDVYQGRVLYTLPLVKLICLSLKKDLCRPEPNTPVFEAIKIGDVIKKAKVEYTDNHGVTVKLKNKTTKNVKGFVPLHHCSIQYSRLDSDKSLSEELHEKFGIDSSHKCRVLSYDYLAQLFICTFDKQIIKAEYLSPEDLKPGMKVKCDIKEHIKNGAFATIIGTAKSFTAFVRSSHLGNVPLTHPEKKFPVGSHHSARVLSVQGNRIQLTLKPLLVESEATPLYKFEEMHRGMECEGVVMLVKENGLLVTFYGDLKGWLALKGEMQQKFYVGQVLRSYVQKVDEMNKKLSLSLKPVNTEGKKKKHKFKVAHSYKVTVTKNTDTALEVECEAGCGLIPAPHLTDNITLAQLLLRKYKPGDVIDSVYCFSNYSPPILTVRPSLIEYFQSEGAGTLSSLSPNVLLPCAVKGFTPTSVILQLPVSGCKNVHINCNDLCNSRIEDSSQLGLVEHQGLLALVRKVIVPKKMVLLNIRSNSLIKAWNFSMDPCVSYLRSYFQDCDKIIEHMKENGNPLATLKPGDRVKGQVVAVEKRGTVVALECGAQGIVTPKLSQENLTCGTKVEGVVLFIDVQNNCAELTIKDSVIERINPKQDGKLDSNLGVGAALRGEVLAIRQEVVIVVLKADGKKQLAYIPVRCHINDVIPELKRYKIGTTSKTIIQSLEDGRIICVLQKYMFDLIKLKARSVITLKKRKRTDSENTDLAKLSENSVEKCEIQDESDSCDEQSKILKESSAEEEIRSESLENREMKRRLSEVDLEISNSLDNDSIEVKQKIKRCKKAKKRQLSEGESTSIEVSDVEKSVKRKRKPLVQSEEFEKMENVQDEKKVEELPRLSLSTGFVWEADPSLLPAGRPTPKSDTSSDEEDKIHKKDRKRKKLSRAERREQARQEEEHLRAEEQKLLDSDRGPQSADDFDRLVLSSPNNSLCWIKYMAFHLQATEIEKARAVAQRALSTISFREEQEKLNVWCALLNLENLYGTKESLDKTLEEAVRMNDPFRVYIQMLQIYADSKKTEEVEKLVSLLTKKFRENKESWLQGGEVLMKLGQLEKARSLMQKALTGLEKKLHVEVISKFAQLENRLGEPERAQTLMEHILTSYPKRTDVWITYVDMLVKSEHLDAARQVLERGIAQKLPARKMKSLFAKFLQFEERHGTPEGAEKVQQMALNYVEAAAGKVEEDED